MGPFPEDVDINLVRGMIVRVISDEDIDQVLADADAAASISAVTTKRKAVRSPTSSSLSYSGSQTTERGHEDVSNETLVGDWSMIQALLAHGRADRFSGAQREKSLHEKDLTSSLQGTWPNEPMFGINVTCGKEP